MVTLEVTPAGFTEECRGTNLFVIWCLEFEIFLYLVSWNLFLKSPELFSQQRIRRF